MPLQTGINIQTEIFLKQILVLNYFRKGFITMLLMPSKLCSVLTQRLQYSESHFLSVQKTFQCSIEII